jgi:hypothetical protein
MTDEPKTKPFGKFRIPVSCTDRTSERSGTQISIIGGIQPKPPAPDGEQPKRDDDKPGVK